MKKLFYIFACCFFVSTVSCEDKTKFLENKPNSNEQQGTNNSTSGTETKPTVTVTKDGHEAVDLGLPSGLLWATCNIGTSIPENIGSYFAWGETQTKTSYTEDNYKYNNASHAGRTKYTTGSYNETIDNKTKLDASDDVAKVKWGGKWHMPSRQDYDELFENTEKSYKKDQNGNYIGYLFTSKNGNTIFFPYTGYKEEYNVEAPTLCRYWTNELKHPGSDSFAFSTYFSGIKSYTATDSWMYDLRWNGCAVRAVWK